MSTEECVTPWLKIFRFMEETGQTSYQNKMENLEFSNLNLLYSSLKLLRISFVGFYSFVYRSTET